MQPSILSSTVIIFGLSIAVLLVCYRLKIPTIVGFLLTGVLCGPSGFGLVGATAEVETLAQIGVVLLLFSIGLEFSLNNLLQIRRTILIGGTLQVALTIGFVTLISWHFGKSLPESVFIGFLLSLSSTAIVLKRLQEKAEVESPHGRTSLGILIFQDIVVVPMMLVLPLLSGTEGVAAGQSVIILFVKILGIIVAMAVLTKWIVPWILFRVAKTKSSELFLLAVIVICFSIAWLTSSTGLSLALGAFLAGLVLSESEYGNQALGSILPFKDVFTSLFFISIGMLFDGAFFLHHPVLILSLTLAVLVLKVVIASLVPAVLGFPLRTMVLTGLSLGQVGEFSFILSTAGMAVGLLDKNTYQLFLGVSILTMAATPFVMAAGPWLADRLLSLPLPKRLTAGLQSSDFMEKTLERQKLNDHLIVVGFGINGRNVARAARAMGIPYVVTEMNPETVRREKAAGEPIIYGDASQEAVLQHVDIRNARVVVVGIPDPIATRRVVETARKLNATVHIIARTRFFQETARLYELGASDVIPEEFETSVEIFTRVLVKYLVSPEVIEMFVAEVRSDSYQMFRNISKAKATFSDLKFALPDVEVNMAWVGEGSLLAGKSLSEIRLRGEFGITLLAVRRGSEVISNPDSSIVLADGDILVILGKPQDIVRFNAALKTRPLADPPLFRDFQGSPKGD
jgi:monovalent cation:H+ antiporter-2, CPA2 family